MNLLAFNTFWGRVDRGKPDACWEWKGTRNTGGYGSCVYEGKRCSAHRIAAYLTGLVPHPEAPHDRRNGGFVLHKCDNPPCCNPAHFEVGTYAENQKQAYARGRRAPMQGSKHANAKLTPDQVRHIRCSGISQRELAALYGVSQTAISQLKRGKTYKEVR